jgi:predicted hotdog family 3-hydroxylacyl-ACP dehydratase
MSALPATRDAIARLIPHQGAMCLLDAVLSCDAEAIRCESRSHRDAANPLRRDGALPALAGVEYAAQAMALHGALTAGSPQAPGFLAALSGVTVAAERLDTAEAPLLVTATALARESRGFIYGFEVTDGARRLLAGRATVVLA